MKLLFHSIIFQPVKLCLQINNVYYTVYHDQLKIYSLLDNPNHLFKENEIDIVIKI